MPIINVKRINNSKTFSLLSGKNIPGLKKMSRILSSHFAAKSANAKAIKRNLLDFVFWKANKAIIKTTADSTKTKNFVGTSKAAAIREIYLNGPVIISIIQSPNKPKYKAL